MKSIKILNWTEFLSNKMRGKFGKTMRRIKTNKR